MSKKTITLIILDGWGVGNNDMTNPIYTSQPKNMRAIEERYQGGLLQASGIAVGLPWNEEGNSEVGHLTIGAGKTLYQHYPRITLAIKKGEFVHNQILNDAISHTLTYTSHLHIAGLLTEGHVHASYEHLASIIELAEARYKNEQYKPTIQLHLFTDGKDSDPQSSLRLLKQVESLIEKNNHIHIASISGRYFSLDRDRHWDRTQETYDAMMGKKKLVDTAEHHIRASFERGLNDDSIPPACIGIEYHSIKDNDALIFFNFREDSIRQITFPFALSQESLDKTTHQKLTLYPVSNLYLTTMTQYSDSFNAHVAFPPEKIINPLGKVLADNNITQLRIAETEKYAHVTYFFNGLTDKPFKNELRILIPSQNIINHAEHPEMMAEEISNRVIEAIQGGDIDFICANFANADIVAHTGDFKAAVTAINTIDRHIGDIMKTTLAHDDIMIITADHGNVERMTHPLTGMPETKHDTSPVPLYIIGKQFEKKASDQKIEKTPVGVLSDIAPTILKLFNIPCPSEMTGQSLLDKIE